MHASELHASELHASECSGNIDVPIKYFLGFDLTEKNDDRRDKLSEIIKFVHSIEL